MTLLAPRFCCVGGARFFNALAGAALFLPGVVAFADPPRVTKSIPADGDFEVDPGLREISIEFDQTMDRDSGYSVVGGGPTYPKTTGDPKWRNGRTLVLPVELEPDHEYWLSINSDKFTRFKNKDGESAVPHPISFRTRGGGAAPALSPEINRKAIDELRRGIEERYSYRDRLGVDWKKRFAEFEPEFLGAKTVYSFAGVVAEFLGAAKDLHVTVVAGKSLLPTFRRDVTPNVNFEFLEKKVPGWKKESDLVYTGQFPDGPAYLFINSWSVEPKEALVPAFAFLESLDPEAGLILDVRANRGGSEPLAGEIGGCFVPKATPYASSKNRDPSQSGGWAGPYERVLEPNASRRHFSGKTAVLCGPVNMSSCEAFLLMMKEAPNCTLIGGRSYGSSGNPKPLALSNGVTVNLSSWIAMTLDGTEFEGRGIEPDVEVSAEGVDFSKTDPVIAAALKFFKEK